MEKIEYFKKESQKKGADLTALAKEIYSYSLDLIKEGKVAENCFDALAVVLCETSNLQYISKFACDVVPLSKKSINLLIKTFCKIANGTEYSESYFFDLAMDCQYSPKQQNIPFILKAFEKEMTYSLKTLYLD